MGTHPIFESDFDCLTDVHPDAILKVLSDACDRSPFGDAKNQAKIERHVARRKAREQEQLERERSGDARTRSRNRDENDENTPTSTRDKYSSRDNRTVRSGSSRR